MRRARRCLRAGTALLVAGLTGVLLFLLPEPAPAQTPAPGETAGGRRGPELYQQHCASCHAPDGTGTHRGPSLVDAGAASADFYLRSGRMPLADPDADATRSPPSFSDEQIRLLVGYIAGLGRGPDIPTLPDQRADRARGGELYRLNCAACHNWDGKGGALVGIGNAPPLHAVPPLQVAEAVRVGPGAMPGFGADALSDDELADVTAYVTYLGDPTDAGGWPLAHWGPATEALAAVVALGLLLLVTGLVGERAATRRSGGSA